jgi:phosphohistidine swiveling domain-containing protein
MRTESMDGIGVTNSTATGLAVTLEDIDGHNDTAQDNLVLVLGDLTPDVMPVILTCERIVAVISAVGSLTSHAAVLLREVASSQHRPIAGLVGVDPAFAKSLVGRVVTVNGASGTLSTRSVPSEFTAPRRPAAWRIARPEKQQQQIHNKDGARWVCPKPSYKFSRLEQSLIASGYEHSAVTLFGQDPCKVNFDSEGRIWISGSKNGEEISRLIIKDPSWFGRMVDQQYHRFGRLLRRLLERRSLWLEVKTHLDAVELVLAWRYMIEAYYHLYRFLPLTSSSYPHLFHYFVEEADHIGISNTQSLALLRYFGQTAAAESAVHDRIFPRLDKNILAFTELKAPYATAPIEECPSIRSARRVNYAQSTGRLCGLPEELAEVVSMMFEAKDQKFYVSSTLQSWAAYLLTCTQAHVRQESGDVSTLRRLTEYSAEQLIDLLQQ